MKRLVTSLWIVWSVFSSFLATAETTEAVVNAASALPIETHSVDHSDNNVSLFSMTQTLLEWLRAQGGLTSPKIEFRVLDESNTGFFAVEPISTNETLIRVPLNCLFTSDKKKKPKMCDTARWLVDEYKLQAQSHYWPYLHYLFTSQTQILPSAWSSQARHLLQTIIGKELEPQNVDTVSFGQECPRVARRIAETEMWLYDHAWRLVVARSWDGVLIPVLDMIPHRNGHWHNVHIEAGRDQVVLVALRDIKAGEPLHISYNECQGCDRDTPNMLRNHGIVESYPRHFHFVTYEKDLLFELNDDNLQVTWLEEPPSVHQLNWLRGHVKRLKSLNDTVAEQLKGLSFKHEQKVIAEFYQALSTALEQAILQAKPVADDDDDYDALDDKPDALDYRVHLCGSYSSQELTTIDQVHSHYQEIEFARNDENLDSCLYLNGWVHSCTSFRPHYHEALVHYPARFVKEVKRVIFIGGGDNMVLHEILKYPTLELVVGLELDQQVVRSSFKNMGIQPHFDNDKVQWWFGDAAKSLQMLPKEYFGTFDLVLVDLMTYIRDTLMVTQELSVMDVAQLLIHADGVMAQNEDFVARSNVDFGKYTVDLEYYNVPEICLQSITIGSNAVDFFNTAPTKHKIDNLYLESGGNHFDGWWNYRTNIPRERTHCMDTNKNESTTRDMMSRHGVLMILETEDAGVPLDSTSSVRASVSQALQKTGLSEISFEFSQDKVSDGFYTMVFMLRQGYVVVRAWPEHKYCGFDLLLWSSFDRQETAKAQLIAAVGSNVVRSSSYRIVTGGMYGIEQGETTVGPNATVLCENNSNNDPVTLAVPFDLSAMDVILRGMISLIQASDPVIAVFCNEQSSPCRSLETLNKGANVKKVIPVWTCPSLSSNGMAACKQETLERLTESIAAAGKIDGIILDPETPRAMGQIMHKILNSTRVQRELLQEEYVVLAAITQDEPGSSWRRALLERFRTQFAQFSPAHRAEVFFNNTNSRLELGVFSTGDFAFYSHLDDAVKGIQKEISLTVEIRKVADAIINYVADIEPSATFNDTDYNHSAAREQWQSQHPLGHQTILQFEIKAPKSPIFPADKVMINFQPQELWSGKWYSGRVVEEKRDGTFDVIYDDGGEDNVKRDLLVKIETEPLPINVGEGVLIRNGDWWLPGSVREQSIDGGTYRVNRFDMEGGMPSDVPRHDLVRQLEPTDTELPEFSTGLLKMALHIALLESGINIGMDNLLIYGDMADGCVVVAFWPAGNVIASWDGKAHIDVNLFTFVDNVVLRSSFSSNFQASVPHLSVISRDEQPRGAGRVVNFQRELVEYEGSTAPHWTSL